MNRKTENILQWIGAIVFVAFFVAGIVSCILDYRQDKKIEKEYGPETYEVVITDKYECLGSTFHVVGGRATETEYHLVYKYRCTNRPNNEHKSSWDVRDRKVNYTTWSRYRVGERFTTTRDPYFLN